MDLFILPFYLSQQFIFKAFISIALQPIYSFFITSVIVIKKLVLNNIAFSVVMIYSSDYALYRFFIGINE